MNAQSQCVTNPDHYIANLQFCSLIDEILIVETRHVKSQCHIDMKNPKIQNGYMWVFHSCFLNCSLSYRILYSPSWRAEAFLLQIPGPVKTAEPGEIRKSVNKAACKSAKLWKNHGRNNRFGIKGGSLVKQDEDSDSILNEEKHFIYSALGNRVNWMNKLSKSSLNFYNPEKRRHEMSTSVTTH